MVQTYAAFMKSRAKGAMDEMMAVKKPKKKKVKKIR